jgi:hypothetical protein
MIGGRLWIVPVAALLIDGTALAADVKRVPDPAVANPAQIRVLVRQKQVLLDQLLGDSLAAARIDASGNTQAQQFLNGAREFYMKGVGMLHADDHEGANKSFNEAIWMMGVARQLVPDIADKGSEQRLRYNQLSSGIESLRRSYRTHLSHLGRTEAEDPAARKVAGLVAVARKHADGGRLAEANGALIRAEYDLLEAFGKVLRTSAIDYTPHFSDAKDEFQFEFERNRSYNELVPVAIAELKPAPDAVRLIVRMVESNRAARELAQRQAANKNFEAALKSIRDGTAELERALLAAGLVMPQEAAKP